jgi:putative multicomponent Na+:H+ antiporter subunit B
MFLPIVRAVEKPMDDSYLYLIVALLPLAAGMVVLQTNPYHALVLRGILGAIAALVYAVLGAADVALTEALVGTMLAITLYAIAVRSSMVMRLGILESTASDSDPNLKQLFASLRATLHPYHLRLELVTYGDREAMDRAFADCKIHGTCIENASSQPEGGDRVPAYHTQVRIARLYEILQQDGAATATTLTYSNPPLTQDL